ncbi:MAG: ornithine carbamoyltransferase [Burkholderiales bacterium]
MSSATHTMVLNLKPRSPNDFSTPSARDMNALLSDARQLQAAARSGTPQHLLRGKNFGLLCDAADDADAALFQRAATALGARVAQLRTSLSTLSTPEEVQHTARVLGRLYDAVDCIGMAPEMVARISAEAGVPVFQAIASVQHPTAGLAHLLDGSSTLDDRRCIVIQAVLLGALA